MSKHRHEFSLEKMADVFGVSRSGFHSYENRKASIREQADAKLLKKVIAIHEDSWWNYGRPRIMEELKEQGIPCGTGRLRKLLKMAGISVKKKRAFKVTTDSNHDLPIAPNLLKRNFRVFEANRAWVSDITYIRTQSGWLYLCVIVDLFSRKIVGWSMKNHMETSLVLSALRMAYENRRPQPGLIFHSDRGVQYASLELRAQLGLYGMFASMSRKGDCWDNACAESIFATLKRELIYCVDFDNQDCARRLIFSYIESFYNRRRRHSYLGYLSPDEFEKRKVV